MSADKIISVVHLDDDLLEHRRVREELSDFCVESFEDANAFKKAVLSQKPDVVLLDVLLKDRPDGLTLIPSVRRLSPQSVVLVISHVIENAREAMHRGADDFVFKRSKPLELALRVESAYRLKSVREIPSAPQYVGETLQRVAGRIPMILESAVSAVLVEGESGTGKEMVCQILEQAVGPRNLKKINCAAISPTLLESELFGHSKGAFTGADRDRIGYIEAAAGGWLFLDEVGELPQSAQAALLRAIENNQIIRVGESQVRQVDFRVLAATNVDLPAAVSAGHFRHDLLQRLREVVVELPPLRDRPGEIQLLIDHFCANERGGPYELADETREILQCSEWRAGNVRELRNCIRAMTPYAVRGVLTPAALPAWMLRSTDKKPQEKALVIPLGERMPSWHELSHRLLGLALDNLGAKSLQMAADALSLPKSTLVSKLKQVEAAGHATKEEIDSWFRKS